MKRVNLAAFSINKILIISHLVLVLALIVGMSVSRYNYEWQLHVDHAAARSEGTLLPHVSQLSILVAGRNYSNLMLPVLVDTFYSNKELLFLDIYGTSDYQSLPVHVRYTRQGKQMWREDITIAEVDEYKVSVLRLENLLLASADSDQGRRAKIEYVLQKAREDYDAGMESLLAKELNRDRWHQPAVTELSYYLDQERSQLHMLVPLRNEQGGQLWAVFEVSELNQIQRQLLKDITVDGFLAVIISLLLILVVTTRLVLPIKRLSEHMKRDIEAININEIEELNRQDELGDLARSFATMIVRMKSQMRVLRDKTYTDTLSGLGSRYKYSRHSEDFLLSAIESGQSFGLMMCDIDNFKGYNDSYGHAKGDKVITAVSQSILVSACEQDECYRIGGEEFVVLTKGIEAADMYDKAEELRMAVEALHIEHEGNLPYGEITISVGMCFIRPDSFYHQDLDMSRLFYELFSKADQQLYLAKSQGRNRALVREFNTDSSQAAA